MLQTQRCDFSFIISGMFVWTMAAYVNVHIEPSHQCLPYIFAFVPFQPSSFNERSPLSAPAEYEVNHLKTAWLAVSTTAAAAFLLDAFFMLIRNRIFRTHLNSFNTKIIISNEWQDQNYQKLGSLTTRITNELNNDIIKTNNFINPFYIQFFK